MKRIFICLAAIGLAHHSQAQTELYPQHFDLEEVTLLDSPLKTAMDKNFQTLLSYDVDRLLNPYIRQAGLTTGDYAGWSTAHPSFPNWGSNDFNLDGHVGGHYLSAVSLAYAACHDATTKAALKAKVDYMVSVMKDCQDVYDNDETGLKGFIGGQPMNEGWQKLYSESNTALRGTGTCAVPWYCQHKILAGLRDAYIYGDNATARTVFLKLCDWCILVTSRLTDSQMESMLNTEHGGVNESLLDAYQLTGEEKYLTAAKRFTHKTMLNGLQSLNTTFLDNKHANTQVPKYIGMERIGEWIMDNGQWTMNDYTRAAENFWTDVAENRTVCIGGNSVAEHFLTVASSNRYIDHLDGPESCNTNNMMKLSEMMADRTHDAKYADFYEYAMWNHILSTQDPTTGGYVYFTTLRPQAYRIYSTVNEGMWCCVGTGMENHSKYGHFIYSHSSPNGGGQEGAKLYVNLFTPSRLLSDDFIVTQETSFPFEAQTKLTVGKAGTYTIAIRHPWWVGEGFAIAVNGSVLDGFPVETGTASYVEVNRTWAEGDVITVSLPMELRYTPCPNYTDYIAFQYGPILLAAQTSTSDADEAATKHLSYEASLQNEYGHEGRMDHAPGSRASSKTLTSAPLLIGDRDGENGVLSKIAATDLSQLQFTLDARREGVEDYTWQTLTLLPFYQIHHARYSCYWYQQTAENFANSTMAAEENAKAALKERTLDFVATGEQQSEAGHFTETGGTSTTGSYNDEYYRDARAGGYVQYTLSYEGEAIESGLSILCRFTQADANRKATLYVDGTPIANITSLAAFNGTVVNGFYNVEFPIPASLMRDAQNNVKQSFVVRLAADKGTMIPGLYYLRLMKEYDAKMPATVTTTAGDVRTVIDYIDSGDNGQSDMSHGLSWSGSNSGSNHGLYNNKYWRTGLSGEYFAYDLRTDGVTEGVSLVVEYYANDNDRLSTVEVEGTIIATEKIHYLRSGYITLEYPIDPVLLAGKQTINVKIASVDNKYTCSANYVYLTTGRTSAPRTKTTYTFVPENFEKNGNDGNISSMTYNDGAIQIASGGGDRSINMRMKTSVKDTYSILPNQSLLLVKGQNLSTTAALWWLMGCNHGASDTPAYTLADGDDTYLVWDLRKVATFSDAEKNARFFGVSEVPVTTSNGGAYSLMCMGLTSSASDHSATISDIGFYSPEQLVDKYAVMKSTVSSIATALTTASQFAYDGYVFTVTDATSAEVTESLSTGGDLSDAPATVFGYTVIDNSPIGAKYRSAIPTEAGEYYLYDVTNRTFLNTADRSTSEAPAALATVTPTDGKFLISCASGKYLKIGVWKGQYLWSDGDASNTKWTIEPNPSPDPSPVGAGSTASEEAEKVYYIYAEGFAETNAEVAGKTMYLTGTNASSAKPAAAQWALITKADYDTYFASKLNPAKVAANKQAIIDAKGDATSLLKNPSFAESADGWTGGNRTSCQLYRGAGFDYESTAATATFSQTIGNMPAGTYKVVAAVRGANAKVTTGTARVAGTAGETVTNNEFVGPNQFNTNGVLMPKSQLGGFNTARYALGWQWLTATGTLAKDGALTIEFEMTGADWKGIADVHLYYMSDGSTGSPQAGQNTYAVEYTPGVDAANHAVTCDLTVTNPNTIFTSTGAAITTISGAALNNNLVDGTIGNLLLYNGYEFAAPEGEYAATSATLYRSIPADQWCTLVVPFVPTTEMTQKVPLSLADGVLTFGDATAASDAPMLVKSATALTSITGSRTAATTEGLTSGQGITMNGTYARIEKVERGSYIAARANGQDALYLVDSDFALAPFRAYFTIPSDGNVKASVLNMNFDGATAIEEVNGKMVNGRSVNGKWFDLNGRQIGRQDNLPKGIYIVNGRKVVIR